MSEFFFFEQRYLVTIFYSSLNALCSSDESYFKWHVFHFHLVQSANTEFLLMKTHRVLCRLSKCANVLYRRCFYSFSINSQPKRKDLAHYSWHIYQEKLASKFNKVSWSALWVGDPKNIHNSFWIWILFY